MSTAAVIPVGKTLVLNQDWKPINVLPIFKAAMKVFSDRALFLDPDTYRTYDFNSWVMEWDEAVRTSQIASDRVVSMSGCSLVLPEIIICSHYRGMGFKVNTHRNPTFSRRNLFIRDRGTCQFCGKRLKSDELTMDHVIPSSRGGETSWENIVLACVPCNNRKANKTPKEANMRLIRQPVQPSSDDLRLSPGDRIRLAMNHRTPKTWEQFLGKMYWSAELAK